MNYIESNLLSGETVVYRAKLHKIVFFWPCICLCFGFPLLLLDVGAGSFWILVAGVLGVSPAINYYSSEFGVTNKKVILKEGFIRRRSIELLLAKVEGIRVDQGIIGRIFGYGTIIIMGTGGTKEPFHKIEKPFEFRKQVQEQMDVLFQSR